MESKKTGQILTIILCAALVVAVIFTKTFTKERDKDTSEVGTIINQDIIVNTDDNVEQGESIKEYVKDEAITETLAGQDLKNVDISLYVEKPDREIVPEGITEILFSFINGEVLYEQDFPSGIYENMMQEFQKYINDNISDPKNVLEIEIIESSIIETEEKLSFKADIGNGINLLVEVNLYTFEYSFSKVKNN